MSRTLNRFNETRFPGSSFTAPGYYNSKKTKYQSVSSPFDAASIFLTFEAMNEVTRPGEELQWRQLAASRRIAWKTGTSFGNRDAWSIGVTPEFVVAVWVGNASGEGRPGLTGIGMAAPVLFEVFKVLPATSWFRMPEEAMVRIPVCRYSGYRATAICEFTDSVWIAKAGARTASCPFHQIVHLDSTRKWQVTSACEAPGNMLHQSWFVLPPVQEWYFRNKNPFYKTLPPFRSDCGSYSGRRNMDLIYPKNNSILYIPTDLNGQPGKAIFRAVHRESGNTVYWHLDEQFMGSTRAMHQLPLAPSRGAHLLTLTDQHGETLSIHFEVINR